MQLIKGSSGLEINTDPESVRGLRHEALMPPSSSHLILETSVHPELFTFPLQPIFNPPVVLLVSASPESPSDPLIGLIVPSAGSPTTHPPSFIDPLRGL